MTALYENRVVAVADLVPYANNARLHSDAQVTQIAASIREFGFTNPLLIDEMKGLIAGHGRLLAARKLNMTEVPAVVVKGLSTAQKRALVMADNKLALNATWDTELLKLELGELQEEGYDLGLIGFADDELAALTPDVDDLMSTGGISDRSELSAKHLKWDDKVAPMTAEETVALNAAFAKHFAENGVAFGFVRRLLGDV